MENRNILNHQFVSYIIIIALAVLSRLVPHPANFAPIGALALFSGANLSGKTRFVVPLSVMLISDLFLGFHPMMIAVYSSFFITILLGMWLKNNKKFQFIIGTSLLSSCLFYLLTNFNYWSNGTLYPKTFNGMMESYTMAIPFFRNTVLGDLFYTVTFFYGFKYLEVFFKKLQTNKLSLINN